MSFHNALTRLHAHDTFTAWHAAHPNTYLAHGFLMIDGATHQPWQIGYYDTKDDRITVFVVEEHVSMHPPSEVFKNTAKVKELLHADVPTHAEEALAAAEAHRAQQYPGHEPLKTMVLLQHLERPLWNISFVTKTFAVCNVKLDAKDLSVLSSSCESLLGWSKVEKGERKT